MIQFPNLHCWLIEIFITLTAFWPLRILNLWKIQKSLVTKGRIWTKSHCLDPTSWKTAFRYTYMCVCGLMYFSNCRVGSKDSCCHSIFSVCMCTLEQCKFWLCVCVLFFVFGDYQSGQRLPGVWVEKSGLGWKIQSLPGICSASLGTWTMCWLLRGCKHRNHFYPSCYLLDSRLNHQIMKKMKIFISQSNVTPTHYTQTE